MGGSKRNIEYMVKIIKERGPLAQRELTDILTNNTLAINGRKIRNPPTPSQVRNYLAKSPHFKEVGVKQISNGYGAYKAKIWDIDITYLNSVE